ncbi:MAG: hypothetical protein A3G87_05705 [Omnitrophica bacterium RIFCSPLOWO2_12_FULL_50_11]|nr:MAG: hypothetical protein A3G87_05705 [Omnitrophica bacterium RIFCSPLOWO2_12_FULL_50_11]
MAKNTLAFLAILLVSLCCTGKAALAADEDIPYPVRIPYRIVRGSANIALGWTEVLLRPFGERKRESVAESLGLAAGHTVERAAFGFQDVFMCWVPDMQMLELYPDWQGWPYLFHWS